MKNLFYQKNKDYIYIILNLSTSFSKMLNVMQQVSARDFQLNEVHTLQAAGYQLQSKERSKLRGD